MRVAVNFVAPVIILISNIIIIIIKQEIPVHQLSEPSGLHKQSKHTNKYNTPDPNAKLLVLQG